MVVQSDAKIVVQIASTNISYTSAESVKIFECKQQRMLDRLYSILLCSMI